MDAHVLRRLGEVLSVLLMGARIEKIQEPEPSFYVFVVYAQKRKMALCLRSGRSAPSLFILPQMSGAGVIPSAQIMRLRKYAVGRRIRSVQMDWLGRRVGLLCGNTEEGKEAGRECWLVLDLRAGATLCFPAEAGEPFSLVEAQWPEAGNLDAACAAWREWPVLTPALRRVLPLMDMADREALLMDLEAGGGDLFMYEAPVEASKAAESSSLELLAWPLPASVRQGREERIWESPVAALEYLAHKQVLAGMGRAAEKAAAAPWEKEVKRLERALAKMTEEESRLMAMCDAQKDAIALQEHLWRFAPEHKSVSVTLPSEDASSSQEVLLNPRLTVRENMEALFHKARRGKRGLVFVAERRKRVEEELRAVQRAAIAASAGMSSAGNVRLRSQTKPSAAALRSTLPKGVEAFMSSDGFALLRGRDAKGNGTLLRLASGHDIWLHVEGGPGAHVLIRRNFSGQEIPERTLHEAGALAAIKSWQKDADRAQVQYAEARHIKPMRGASLGMVRIDRVLYTLAVDIVKGIEEHLRQEAIENEK